MTEEYPPLTDRELDQLASTYRLGWEGFADEEALAILRLVAEVRRLQAREAALVALLERTQPFLAGYLCNGWQEGDKLSALEVEIKKALAADPSAPATTEERP